MADLKPKFKLKEPNSEEPTLIILKLYINNQRIVYSSGKKIDPKYWDRQNQIVISVRLDDERQKKHDDINYRLNDMKNAVMSINSYIDRQEIIPTKESIIQELDQKLNKNHLMHNTRSITLNEYIDKLIKERETGKRFTESGQVFKKGTIKNLKGFQAQFNEYQKKRGKKIDFKDITLDFYDNFLSFFNQKNYKPNTIGRHIKHLKTIMNLSREEGLHNNSEPNRKKFKVLKVDTRTIYLTLDELERMYNLDLSENPAHALARDVFLVGAFTALRFSDYSRISKDHIGKTEKDNECIDIITTKTGERVMVPTKWHWILEDLLKKYDYTMPKTYEQKVNEYIKKVGKAAKINELIEVEEYSKGMKVINKVPKYSRIMTHTARRSGATNMYKQGISTVDIMKITGHKLESNFFKYIKLSKEETVDRVIDNFKVIKPLEIAK